jgi:hypothetical protein
VFIVSNYRLSEKGVQTLVWQNQAKAWTPTKIFFWQTILFKNKNEESSYVFNPVQNFLATELKLFLFNLISLYINMLLIKNRITEWNLKIKNYLGKKSIVFQKNKFSKKPSRLSVPARSFQKPWRFLNSIFLNIYSTSSTLFWRVDI